MFNVGLYKEGLRKTGVLGLIFTMGTLLITVIVAISHIVNHAHYIDLARRENWDWVLVDPLLYIGSSEIFAMMALMVFIATPLLTLTVFTFLNSRNSSDFYHAIPHKRETIFISFISSILTWLIGAILLIVATALLIYTTSSYTVFHFGDIFKSIAGGVVIILLLIGGITLAMSLTGSALSNLALSMIILFFPRLLMGAFVSMVVENTAVVNTANFGFLGDFRRNLLLGTFSAQDLPEALSYGLLYTFILALVYLILAGYFFKWRHSEVASNPGTKISQPLIRIIVTFIVTLPGLMIILSDGGGFDFIPIAVIYGLAILGYFLYELFTARKIQSFAKMLPGIGIVFLLNVTFIISVNVTSQYFLREIDVNRLTSAEIVTGTSTRSFNIAQLDMTMWQNDLEVVSLLGMGLNESIERNNRWSASTMEVRFTMEGGQSITRIVGFTADSAFVHWLHTYEPYRNSYLYLPVDILDIWAWDALTDEQMLHVLEVLHEEIQQVDFDKWYGLVGYFPRDTLRHDLSDHLEVEGQISIHFEYGGQNFTQSYPLTQLTPQALALYLSYIGQQTE